MVNKAFHKRIIHQIIHCSTIHVFDEEVAIRNFPIRIENFDGG